MGELVGVLFALMALALAVALLTYDPADPSLNTATFHATRNLVGPAGAITADLMLQGFGLAAGLPVLCLLAWAWRLATQRGLGTFPLRLIGFLAGLPLVAAAVALLPLPGHFLVQAGPGGAIGSPVAAAVVNGLTAALGPFGTLIGNGLIAILALLAVFLACGLSGGEWRGAGRAALGGARVAAGAGVMAAGAAGRLARASARGIGDLRGPGHEDDRPEPEAASYRAAPPPEAPAVQPRRSGFFRRGLDALLSRRARPAQVPLHEMLRNADAAARVIPPDAQEPPLSAHRGRPPSMPDEEEDEAPPPRLPPASRPKVAPPVEARRSKAVQPALDLGEEGFRLPPVDLLVAAPARRSGGPSEESLQANARLLESVLDDYGVRGRIAEIRPGPVVTLYELEPAPGTKSARVIGLADDIARSMSVVAVRIATVPGRNVIGIEMPNAKRETVFFSEMMLAEDWARTPGKLNLALGKDIGGAPVVADLARMPHLLIAGTTGSGKSVAVNTMILSLLFRMTPDECRFIMIDPKMLELSVYDRIPHLLAPVVTEPAKAIGALKWTVREMERRYRLMSQLGVRNIGGYNDKVGAARIKGETLTRRVQVGFDPETGKPVFEDQPLALEPLPMIVVIIDEVADLMMVAGKDIEAAVQRLAQMARAAGIHVVMATQRPSVDVITGTIKANFPTRISFQVTSKIDSRTILGEQGAEQLLGQGDMLHMAGGGRVTRVHGPFVSDAEVERVVEFLREQGEPAYVEEVTEVAEDEDGAAAGLLGGNTDAEASLFDQAVALVSREGKASTSFIQRHLSIGYNRAAKLIEQMEKEGIVGPANHVGKREVLTRRSGDE
ncbi:cell division protein FtsK [Roseomonas hellenica]|uniref:DNA translocase FtsK n=3 Tax=Plastoroseomonas hellenica TaxID=2687306 RepID=A0ABS5F4P3_9PROT|nr:cell division protein FtsK [Plastoroseomonas hellenica]